ncbi:MAG: hypothetical protein JXA07_15440 [Spirochaetes bacterium]|nr:hypothetical protein [Spirochaetota bacterium]
MTSIRTILTSLLALLASSAIIAVVIPFPARAEKKTGEVIRISDNGLDYSQGKDADVKQPERESTEPETLAGTADESEDLLDDTRKARFKFKGQIKNLFSFHRTDNFFSQNPLVSSQKNLSANLTRVRLSPEFRYGNILTVRVDYDNELIASNYGKSLYFKSYWRSATYNDLLHISWEPYRGDEVFYRTKIHRAYVKVAVDHFTATVGRQQIRFGSGKLWNPLDILSPISPTFIESGDEQKGTDAVRLDFFPDDKTEISAIVDLKKSNDKIQHVNVKDCNYVLRAKTSIKDTDIAILGGYVTRRGLAGFDFASIVFDGMLRGSVMVSQAGDPYLEEEDPWYPVRYMIPGNNMSSPVFFTANAGYEYTFKVGVFFLVEYFYNQKAVNYSRDMKMAFYAKQFNAMDQKTHLQLANQFLTVNQHYLAVALGYDFHPLVRGEFFTIADIQGQSIFWAPSISINAYENLDFSVGMMGAFTFNDKFSDFTEFRKNYLFYASGSYVF